MISKQRVFDLIKAKEYEKLERELVGKKITGLSDSEESFDGEEITTPLIAAAIRNDERAVLILLNHGEDPNDQRGYGSPLDCAASNRSASMLKLLLDRGASYSRSTVGPRTVITSLLKAKYEWHEPEGIAVKRNACIDVLVAAGLLREFLKDVKLDRYVPYTAIIKLIEVGFEYWRYPYFMGVVECYPKKYVTAIFNAVTKRETLAFKAYNRFVDNLYIEQR